jgi:hypothetical protein
MYFFLCSNRLSFNMLGLKPVSTGSSLLFLAFGYVFTPDKFLLSHDRVVLYFLINEIHVQTCFIKKKSEQKKHTGRLILSS